MRTTFPGLILHFRLVVAIMLLALAGTALADTCYLMNGKSTTTWLVENFAGDKTGGNFYYRLIGKNGKVEGKFVPLPAAQVLSVEFRESDDKEKAPKGRVANLTMVDGKVVNHLILETFVRTKTGPIFRFRKTGIAPGGKTIEVSAAQVQMIELAPPEASLIFEETKLGKLRKATRDGDLANVLDTPPPAPAADPSAAAPAGPEQPMTDEERFSKLIGADKVYGNNNPLTENSKPKKKGMFDIGNAKTGAAIEALGVFMILALLGGIVFLTFVAGTFILLFSAKNQGINDLTVPRAIATSALLALVPPGLFCICIIIPFPICSLKLTAGIFLWWASAKMIVGGMLEVQEGKATDILISFYLMIVLCGCVFWIWATWR